MIQARIETELLRQREKEREQMHEMDMQRRKAEIEAQLAQQKEMAANQRATVKY